MRLTSLVITPVLVLGGFFPCFGQQSSGPATLENLLKPGEAPKPSAAPEAKALETGPMRPTGVVVRPTDGVQHPDLDKAWAEYEATVAKATENIEAAITKQFDAVTAKGDLDAAEKWLGIGEKFKKAGELPAEKETKVAVSAAVSDYRKARDELAKAYDVVVKTLTMAKKIVEAKAVRNELTALQTRASDDVHKDGAKAMQSVFIVDLKPSGFRSGTHEGHYSLNGRIPVDNAGKVDHGPIRVGGGESPKSFCIIAPSGSFSELTFAVPDGCSKFRAGVAMADTSKGQKTPITFRVMAGERNELWSSKPLGKIGEKDACDISVKGVKAVVLRVECPGDWFNAHSIWVEPRFVK